MKNHYTINPEARPLSGRAAPKAGSFPGWISILVLVFTLAGTAGVSAQQTNLGCTLTSTPITSSSFANLSVATSASFGSGWAGVGNVIDASLTNNASAGILVSGNATLRVTDATHTYSAGNYVGFVVGTSGLSLSALSNITLRTYISGSATPQETINSASLLSLSVSTNQVQIGFYTDKPYNAIEIEYASVLNVLATFDVYYAVMRGTGGCAVTATAPCNAPIHPRFDNFRMVVDPVRTSVTGISTASWTDLGRLVDTDTTNFATLGLAAASVLGTANLGIKRTVGTFPAGYFAGFDIENRGLLGLGLLNNVTIAAYRNDTLVGSASGTSLLLGATLLGNSGRQTIGFITTDSFDEVQLTMLQPVSVNLGTTLVYGPVIRNFCAGPTPPCNIPVAQKEVSHPVYINTPRTGFTGGVCALCRIDSVGNLLDTDTLNAATIDLAAGVATTGSIAVRDAVTTHPGGSYAGFEIANPSLLNLGVLANISVSTYRAGVLKQRFSGNSLLVSLPTSLITTQGRYSIGFLADSSFDEMQLSLNQTATVNLGTTYVYTALFERFCPGVIACRTTNWLNAPDQSILIDQRETGITGAACVGCAVNNPANVISASTTDFAQLITTAGVIASSSLAVKDAANTYPARSIAGFAVQDPSSLLQLNLLRSITISTYNDGVLQESANAGQLLNLSLLVVQLNPSAGYYNLGMQTTRPFDEVKISVTPLAGVAPVLNVYGAYVDTRFVDTISSSQICARPPVADPDHIGTPKNIAVNGNLRTNDRDPAGLALSYNPAPAVAPLHGTLTINSNGTFSYVPATGYAGLDSFAYTVCNTQNQCSTGWAFISVLDSIRANASNRPHVLQPDRSETHMNVPVSGDAAANDIDVEQRPLMYAVTMMPQHGTLSLTTTGQYIYTPDSSYIGTDSAIIMACDTATPQICRSASLRLVIYPNDGPANSAPFAADDIASLRQGMPATGNVLTNDKDPDNDPITAAPIATIPGTTGVFTMAPNGMWSFTPAATFIGTVNIPYVITDASGKMDTATLSIVSLPYLGPDYTPTIAISAQNLPMVGAVQDFRIDVSEVRNSLNDGQLTFRIFKPSAFTIIHSDTMTVINAATGLPSPVTNSNWTFTETATSVICTLKPGVPLPGFSIHSLGFRLQRKPNIPANTTQNLTIGISPGTAGDGQIINNQYSVSVTAQ